VNKRSYKKNTSKKDKFFDKKLAFFVAVIALTTIAIVAVNMNKDNSGDEDVNFSPPVPNPDGTCPLNYYKTSNNNCCPIVNTVTGEKAVEGSAGCYNWNKHKENYYIYYSSANPVVSGTSYFEDGTSAPISCGRSPCQTEVGVNTIGLVDVDSRNNVDCVNGNYVLKRGIFADNICKCSTTKSKSIQTFEGEFMKIHGDNFETGTEDIKYVLKRNTDGKYFEIKSSDKSAGGDSSLEKLSSGTMISIDGISNGNTISLDSTEDISTSLKIISDKSTTPDHGNIYGDQNIIVLIGNFNDVQSNSACTPENIKNLYIGAEAITNGLVGSYKFDNSLLDDSGRNNHATATGVLYKEGIFSNALDLVRSPNAPIITNEANFDFTNALTITAWIKTNSLQKGGIFDKLEATSPYSGYSLVYSRLNDGKISFFSLNTGWKQGTTALNDNKWHYVAIAFEGGIGKTGEIWVDGKKEISFSAPSVLTINNVQPKIGKDYKGVKFNGYIDELRVYNRKLVENEQQLIRMTTNVNQNEINSYESLKHHYEANSYGATKIKYVNVYGPFNVGMNIGSCSAENEIAWMEALDREARARGIVLDDPTKNNRIQYVIPYPSGCSHGGIAYGSANPSRAIVYGCEYGARAHVHELGHNLGMGHSSAGTDAYGDHSDVMGSGELGLINSPHKVNRQWINSETRSLDIFQSGVYQFMTSDIHPNEAGTFPQLLRIHFGGDYTYTASYRTSQGLAKLGFDLMNPQEQIYTDKTNIHKDFGAGELFMKSFGISNDYYENTYDGIKITQRRFLDTGLFNGNEVSEVQVDLTCKRNSFQAGAYAEAIDGRISYYAEENIPYTLYIHNSDTQRCRDSTTYRVTCSVPEGWSTTFQDTTISVPTKTTQKLSFTVKSSDKVLASSFPNIVTYHSVQCSVTDISNKVEHPAVSFSQTLTFRGSCPR